MYSKVIEFYLKKINSTASFSEVKLIDSYIDEMERRFNNRSYEYNYKKQ